MRQRIKRIDVAQTAKVLGLLYLLLGVVFAAIVLFFGSMMPDSSLGGAGMMLGTGFIIAMPIVYGVLGVIVGALISSLYNLVAAWTGGFELDLETPVA